MRNQRRAAVAAVLALLFVAGCTSGSADSPNAEQPPPVSPEFAPSMQASLAVIPPFGLVTDEPRYKTPPNISEPLGYIHDGWADYLGGLNNPKLVDFRAHSVEAIEPVEVPGASPPVVVPCQNGTVETFIYYCRALPAAPDVIQQTGLVVLPQGFSERLQKLPAQDARLVAGIVAAVFYRDHLLKELSAVGIKWPSGGLFDWCTAGVSLRAVASEPLDSARLERALAAADKLVGVYPPANVARHREYMVFAGYHSGHPDRCIYDLTTQPPT